MQDSDNYKIWLNIIGENLKEGKPGRMHLYICDLHFAENCFQQHKAVVNKDKFKVIVPRQRLGLKAGSVPSIFQVSTYIFFKTLLARIIHFYKTIFFLFWVVQPECIDYREPTAGFSKYFRQFELSPNEYPTTTNSCCLHS